jgi:NAD(P)-dependent dehydrogenase (short-subunit alcohol dehydrogenase family)
MCAPGGAAARQPRASSLGAVVGEHGIRVNAIEPGWIKTNMSAPMFDAAPEVWKYYIDRIALHRPGEPEEMAGAIAFFLSDDASYVTSATLLTDAGFIVNAEL